MCADEDQLDCTEKPGCESWMGDHDTCGACDKKCGVTQVCKTAGGPGNWSYFCASK